MVNGQVMDPDCLRKKVVNGKRPMRVTAGVVQYYGPVQSPYLGNVLVQGNLFGNILQQFDHVAGVSGCRKCRRKAGVGGRVSRAGTARAYEQNRSAGCGGLCRRKSWR